MIISLRSCKIQAADKAKAWNADQAAARMFQYYDRMEEPKPFVVRTGEELKRHCEMIRAANHRRTSASTRCPSGSTSTRIIRT